jgi:hypothetical protein
MACRGEYPDQDIRRDALVLPFAIAVFLVLDVPAVSVRLGIAFMWA